MNGDVLLHKCPDGHLYFKCAEGEHFINGQLNDDGELVGLSVNLQ